MAKLIEKKVNFIQTVNNAVNEFQQTSQAIGMALKELSIFTNQIDLDTISKYNKVVKNTLKGLNLIDLTKFQEITNSFPKEFKQFFFSEEYKDFINSFPLPQENYITEFKNEN